VNKKLDLETRGERIDALELALTRGQLSRRGFMAGALELGVSLSVAGAILAQAEAAQANQRERRRSLRAEYDYVIVGAGSAGCVLAQRLSASGASVLVLEAGTGDVALPKVTDAELWLDNLGSDTDWRHVAIPQAGLGDREIGLPAGRALGGTGSINAMFWLRGDVRDFQHWHDLVGSRWAPLEVLRAFTRIEHFLPGGGWSRGTAGPISVGRYAPDNPLSRACIEGSAELGVLPVDHNDSAAIDGAGFADVNITPDGRRSGPLQGYLLPALHRPNLTVLSDTLVTGLELRGSTCRGVRALVDGQRRRFEASCEVVLCAGALGSPRVLMCSGIGPERALRAADIAVQHRLPAVGRNLHDHVFLLGVLFVAGPALPASYTLGRVGTHSFLRTNPEHEAPNIQVMCMQVPFPPGALPVGGGFSILPWVAKPKSRGSVRVSSAEASAPLVIDPGFLRDPRDLEVLLVGLDHSIDLGFTSALAPFTSGLTSPELREMSRAEKVAFIAQNAGSGLHYAGSCSAGRDPDRSVVDECFRVWGLERLRIVDASVIPELQGVNPQPGVLALAELAAEAMGRAP
jgi:choline dehydrogenase